MIRTLILDKHTITVMLSTIKHVSLVFICIVGWVRGTVSGKRAPSILCDKGGLLGNNLCHIGACGGRWAPLIICVLGG